MARKSTPRTPSVPTPKEQGRVQRLTASDPKVRDWYNEKALRSRLAADTYVRTLGFVSDRLGLSPEAIVTKAMKEPDDLRARFAALASGLKKEGWLDNSIAKGFQMSKAYLKYRHAPTDVFPPLTSTKGESLGNERVPTQEELGLVLDKLSLRGRVTALFMAHSGVRPQVLGSYQAEGGLRLRDLPDLKLQGGKAIFAEAPFVVRVPAALSKTRTAYTTFGTPQLATALLAYLDERRDAGEKLGADSPVISSRPTRGAARVLKENAAFSTGFLTTSVLMREIHGALTSSLPEGVTWRPYVLRAYCSTRLLTAEGEGKITRDLREAIMGHDLGVAGRYNLGKPWGADLLKEARAAYKRCEPYLSTNIVQKDSQGGIRALKLFLLARGVPADRIEGFDFDNATDAEIVDLVKKLGASAAPARRMEKAVPVEDVPKMLEAGWEFVSTLNGSMAVLRSPDGA